MELIGHEIAFPRTLQGFHGAILGAGRNKESLAHFVNGLVMMAVRDPFRTAEKRSQPALRIDFNGMRPVAGSWFWECFTKDWGSLERS